MSSTLPIRRIGVRASICPWISGVRKGFSAAVSTAIAPGQTIDFEFVANYPGVYMYHCGTPMVLEHIASGELPFGVRAHPWSIWGEAECAS